MQNARSTAVGLAKQLAAELADFDAAARKLTGPQPLTCDLAWWVEASTAVQIAEDRGASLVLHEYAGRYNSLERSILSARNSQTVAAWICRAATGSSRDSIAHPETIEHVHHMTMNGLLEAGRIGRFRTNSKVKIFDPRTGKVTAEGTPPNEVAAAMNAWAQNFSLANMADVHPLVRSGLAHFELQRIHPFPDGNGRVARVMIAAMHAEDGVPALPFPLEIERRREDYLATLTDASKANDPAHFVKWHIATMRESVETALTLEPKLAALSAKMARAVQCEKISEPQAKSIAGAIVARPITTAMELALRAGVDERQCREGFYRLEQHRLDTKHATVADLSFFVCLDAMKEAALEFGRVKDHTSQAAAAHQAAIDGPKALAGSMPPAKPAAPVKDAKPTLRLVHNAPER